MQLLKALSQKKIVTLIDISIDFYLISKIFDNSKIKFYAIQNAYRQREILSKFNYLPNYFTFGQYEINIIKESCTKMPRLKSVGSLKAANAKEFFLKNNVQLIKNLYDICLVSEAHFYLNKELAEVKDVNENIALVANYTHKFCNDHNKKLIFSGRSDRNNHKRIGEKIYYQNQIKDKKFKITFPDREKFENYKNVAQSDLIIATHSTMLKEALAFKKKVLCCNWVDKTEFPSDGICVLNSKKYEDFEERVLEILKMSYLDYLEKIKDINLTYNTSIDTLKFLRAELK